MRRSHRLKRREDFTRVYNSGRSAAGRLLVLYAQHADVPCVRFGFAAGRKLGSAVVRNRTKRRLREVARKRLADVIEGNNLIVIARAGALKATVAELDKELAFLLRKLNVLYQR